MSVPAWVPLNTQSWTKLFWIPTSRNAWDPPRYKIIYIAFHIHFRFECCFVFSQDNQASLCARSLNIFFRCRCKSKRGYQTPAQAKQRENFRHKREREREHNVPFISRKEQLEARETKRAESRHSFLCSQWCRINCSRQICLLCKRLNCEITWGSATAGSTLELKLRIQVI